ncbi:MAG TPA: 4-(cytidine 5'-diphospho)-2-C-methyl-D-erythritol kinase [Desulfobacteraceae bacterium]|nr:4-(cytidine 5'-diphospho)-2-C-methyl-D-erythritol kinase [Desulfobacteraceae bacterium]
MITRAIARAKINLFLQVVGKRDDGYHDLCSLMTALDLWDCLDFDFQAQGLSVFCDHPGVPGDETNLAFQAARVFMDRFLAGTGRKKESSGLAITIHKTIPIGAGLGGGSSNAATVLKVLNQRHGHPFSTEELMEMGLGIGADVPFFLHGGPALATGVGETLEKYPPLLPYYVVLFFPGVSVSTGAVYKNIDFPLTKHEKSNINNPLKIRRSGPGVDVRACLQNDLESAALKYCPEIGFIREEMAGFNPDGMLMSGSGSSYFALFSRYEKAEQAFMALSRKWEKSEKKIFLTCFASS